MVYYFCCFRLSLSLILFRSTLDFVSFVPPFREAFLASLGIFWYLVHSCVREREREIRLTSSESNMTYRTKTNEYKSVSFLKKGVYDTILVSDFL